MGEMCTLRTGKLCRKPSISVNALALVNVQNCKTAQFIVSRHAASQRSFQSLRTAEVTTLNSLCMVTHDKSQQGSESYIYTRIELGVSMVKRLNQGLWLQIGIHFSPLKKGKENTNSKTPTKNNAKNL